MEPDQWVKAPDPVKEWDPAEAAAAKTVKEVGDRGRVAANVADVASLKAKKVKQKEPLPSLTGEAFPVKIEYQQSTTYKRKELNYARWR